MSFFPRPPGPLHRSVVELVAPVLWQGPERRFWVCLVQVKHSQQRGILPESHWDGAGWVRSESAGIGGSRGAQKLLQEQLQLCFELFLPARGVSGPRCDSGRGGAVGLTAPPLFIRWQGRTGSARESREALYKQGEERQREGSGLEIAAVNTTRFTPGQLGAG